MAVSQNLTFVASIEKDAEYNHPPGAALMRRLGAELAAGGWITDSIHNWRDCGWSVECCREGSKLEVVVSEINHGRWMLQISPWYLPRLFGHLFGRKPSATSTDVQRLALSVCDALSRIGILGDPRWHWDGFPDEKSPTEPQPP